MLREWLLEQKKKDIAFREVDFANLIGIDYATLSRIKSAKLRPSLETSVLIEKLTKGEIKAMDLMMLTFGKHAKRGAKK